MSIVFTIKRFKGEPRSGKTLSMVAHGYNDFLEIKTMEYDLLKKKKLNQFEKDRLKIFSDFKIMSNLDLNKKIYGEYEYITFQTIINMYENKRKIRNRLILFDDIFKYMDSYEFLKKNQRQFVYFLKECGKTNNIFYYVAHYETDVARRLRLLTEYEITCRKGKISQLVLENGETIDFFEEDSDYYEFKNTQKEINSIIIENTQEKKKRMVINGVKRDIITLYNPEYIEARKFFKHYKTGEVV